MVTIRVNGWITSQGKLEVELPEGLPPGDVRITIEPVSDEIWTDEELEELLHHVPPMTGKEIVEAGMLGGWKDLGITDGAAPQTT